MDYRFLLIHPDKLSGKAYYTLTIEDLDIAGFNPIYPITRSNLNGALLYEQGKRPVRHKFNKAKFERTIKWRAA